MKKTTTFSISADILKRAQQASKSARRSLSWVIERLLDRELREPDVTLDVYTPPVKPVSTIKEQRLAELFAFVDSVNEMKARGMTLREIGAIVGREPSSISRAVHNVKKKREKL